MLTQLQGVSEAAGEAIGSGCFLYEFFGPAHPNLSAATMSLILLGDC